MDFTVLSTLLAPFTGTEDSPCDASFDEPSAVESLSLESFLSWASAFKSSAPCFARASGHSRAALLFAERIPGGVIGMPHGLTVSTDALDSADSEAAPHFTVFGSILHASRACRIDVRDKPGGEPTTFARDLNLAAVGGVEGAVRKVLLSKRHGLLRVFESWPAAADEIVVLSDTSTLHASRACRAAACDFPDGEAGV